MRRVGCWNVMLGGGGKRLGADGGGLDARASGTALRRGRSFGSFCDKSAGFEGTCSSGIGRGGLCVAAGIFGNNASSDVGFDTVVSSSSRIATCLATNNLVALDNVDGARCGRMLKIGRVSLGLRIVLSLSIRVLV